MIYELDPLLTLLRNCWLLDRRSSFSSLITLQLLSSIFMHQAERRKIMCGHNIMYPHVGLNDKHNNVLICPVQRRAIDQSPKNVLKGCNLFIRSKLKFKDPWNCFWYLIILFILLIILNNFFSYLFAVFSIFFSYKYLVFDLYFWYALTLHKTLITHLTTHLHLSYYN